MKETFKTKPIQNDDTWIDVHDDALMVELGLRNPEFSLDTTIREKTPQEKKLLKTLRRTTKLDDNYFHFEPIRRIPVKARLIVYLTKNKKFANTVYSIDCWQHEIGNYLMYFSQRNRKTDSDECLVSKYIYNGKTYLPSERPFWGKAI